MDLNEATTTIEWEIKCLKTNLWKCEELSKWVYEKSDKPVNHLEKKQKKTVSEEIMVKLGMWMKAYSMPNVAKPINNVKPEKTINGFPHVKALIILAIALSKEWKRLKPSQHYSEREVENISKALHVFSRSFSEKRRKRRTKKSREGLVRCTEDFGNVQASEMNH